MAFLNKNELKTASTVELIDKLIGYDETIVTDIIDETISTMKGYLSKYYDVDAIFSATGATRHKTVLKHLKGICVFEIYERQSREHNASSKRRYDEAMLWLENLNKGEYYDRTLPARTVSPATDTATESEDIRFGGNIKQDSNY